MPPLETMLSADATFCGPEENYCNSSNTEEANENAITI